MSTSLYKREKLCNKQDIQTLFSTGKAFFIGPLHLIYSLQVQEEEKPTCQILFSAPKRKFPKAVLRNRIKRRCREAFRLEKNEILSAIPSYKNLRLIILYQHTEVKGSAEIQSYLKSFINKLKHG